MFEASREFARGLDEKDILSGFRNKFGLPSQNSRFRTYFCGNSLGMQPKEVSQALERVLGQWQNLGVESFFEADASGNSWMDLHKSLNHRFSSFVGGLPHEVVLMNSLTVNLHFLLKSFYQPTNKKYKILMEGGAFPSDQYAVAAHLAQHGYSFEDGAIELESREEEYILRTEDIISEIRQYSDEISMVLLGGINYYTGQLFELDEITQEAKKHGIVVGLDLAHAIGNVPLKLHEWDVDFAVWCNYKYMNGGPGTIGGAFVHEKYGKDLQIPRLAGWWGNEEKTRFLMGKEFVPELGAAGWQLSTPPILLLATLEASIKIFEEAGLEGLFAKRKLMVSYLRFLIKKINQGLSREMIKIITPENPDESGAQLSLIVVHGKKVYEDLMKNGIVVDWREPDVIRLAPVPLYNTFEEIFEFYDVIKRSVFEKT